MEKAMRLQLFHFVNNYLKFLIKKEVLQCSNYLAF